MLVATAILSPLAGLLALLGVAAAVTLALYTFLLAREVRNPPAHTVGWAIARGLPVDPGERGLRFTDWSLDRPGGARLPVWEIAGRGPPDAPTAILVHGWGHSRIDTLARLAPWDGLCPRVVLWDLRGHGDAEGARTRLGDGEDEDLLELIGRVDAERVVLGGFSMGAVIAMAAAARRDPRADRVAGVVAVGPYLDFHASLRGRVGRSGYPVRPMSDLVLAAFRLAGIRPPGAGRVASDLRCPLLVLHGSDDVVCPPEHGREIASMALGGRFCMLHGAKHSDGHLVAADVLESEIAAFVRSLGPAASAAPRPESPVRP